MRTSFPVLDTNSLHTVAGGRGASTMPIVLGIGPKSPPVIPAGTKGLTAGQAARIMTAPSYPQAFGFRYNIGSGYSGR